MQLPDSAILKNLYVPGTTKTSGEFERKYINVRTAEKRMYLDEEVELLPEIAATHPHYREWVVRKRSTTMLIDYFKKKNKKLDILEVGCGNGWLSYRLSTLPSARVVGVDINFTELQQAAKVFNKKKGVRFIYGDIETGILKMLKFDVILFAASIQYFESLDSILNTALSHLTPQGEIHIIDTSFYSTNSVQDARRKTAAYYASIGYPEMTRYYFHHCMIDLNIYQPEILYDPASVWNRILRKSIPFPWICIKKDNI